MIQVMWMKLAVLTAVAVFDPNPTGGGSEIHRHSIMAVRPVGRQPRDGKEPAMAWLDRLTTLMATIGSRVPGPRRALRLGYACPASMMGTVLLLAACGGESGGRSGVSVVPGTSGTPPSPTPSATPIPAPSPSPPPAGARIAGALPGDTLAGLVACARDPVTKDAQGHVMEIKALTGAKIDNRLSLA